MQIKDVAKKYYDDKKSIIEIAKEYNTYPQKVSKILKDNGYKLRTKAESQKIVLDLGKANHPTKGKNHSEETKNAISEKNHEVWKNLSEKDLKKRSKIGKRNWKKLSKEQKEDFFQKGRQAVLETTRNGSALENYLYNILKQKYNIIMHKKGLVANDKLEVDLFISDLNTIIEIDGPSHFQDIWKDGSLQKNIRSDNEKTALLLNKGFIIIRVKDLRKNKSQIYFKNMANLVLKTLEKIEQKYPSKKNRFIEIELDK